MVGQSTAYIMGHRKTPDPDPWFIRAAVNEWWQQYQDDGNLTRDMAIPGSRIRASWAGKCAKAIAYHVAGTEETNPPTVADCWRMNIGSVLHDYVQGAVERAFPGSIREVVTRIGDIGSGHMDVHVQRHDVPDGRKVAVEIKTINGYGYKRMLGRDGEGPRYQATIQGALNAANMDDPPDELVVAFFSLELIGASQAQKMGIKGEYARFATQWTYSKDEYMELAREEMIRMERIVGLVDNGDIDLVPLIVPDPNLPQHKVISPARATAQIFNDDGALMGTRWIWHCEYCPFQERCDHDNDRIQEAARLLMLERSVEIAQASG